MILIGSFIYYLFYDLNRLPVGTFQGSYISPEKTYTLKIYLVEGTLTSPGIRGELNYNYKNTKNKNIYWNHNLESANVYWETDDIVVINGIKIDVRWDTYDFRRDN